MRRDNAALAVKIIRSHGMWVAVAAWLRKLGRSKCLFLIVPTLEGFHIYNFLYTDTYIHTYIRISCMHSLTIFRHSFFV